MAVGVVADITAFHAIEHRLDQQERQILRTQKVEAIGRLAAGVAHDFNNLLTIIQLNARLALDEIDEDNPARDDIAELLGASERAARLTDQLLAYSRQQVQTLRTLDVRAETERLLTLMRHVLGPEVRVALDLPPNLPHTTADAGQFEQMLTNLLLNARDALGRAGQITITGSAVHTATASWVRLVVQDNGVGMDPETLARASEPFFTTKPTGQGTGLGLATVFGIVEQSGGRASIASELGRGTTITLDLPIASDDRTPTITPLPANRATRGSGDIVVVDDETELLTLVCRVLRTAGYTPHAASSAAAARALLNDLPHVDALITDVRMPVEDGKALARAARQLLPSLPILFISGYAEELDVDEAEGRAFLPKPVTGNDLLLALKGLMGERRTPSIVSDELFAQAEDALTRQLTDPGLGDA